MSGTTPLRGSSVPTKATSGRSTGTPSAPSTARSAPSAGSRGVKRSWSTPCGATTTGARTSHHGRSRSSVTWLTQISTPACRAARRMARRKKAALERRCHSGWSKKVQSWIVTAQGTGDRAGIV